MATAVLGTWGRATAVRFPQELCEKLGFRAGDKVEIVERSGECIVRRGDAGRTFADRFAEWDGKRLEVSECDWGDPRGAEVWE